MKTLAWIIIGIIVITAALFIGYMGMSFTEYTATMIDGAQALAELGK